MGGTDDRITLTPLREWTPRAGKEGGNLAVRSGIDLVSTERIADALSTTGFRESVFTEAEREYCDAKPHTPAHYAARWAAKEAFRKTVPGAAGDVGHDAVEVRGTEAGPELVLDGRAGAALSRALPAGVDRRAGCAVSLTHDATSGVAAAQVSLCIERR